MEFRKLSASGVALKMSLAVDSSAMPKNTSRRKQIVITGGSLTDHIYLNPNITIPAVIKTFDGNDDSDPAWQRQAAGQVIGQSLIELWNRADVDRVGTELTLPWRAVLLKRRDQPQPRD